MGPLFRWYHPTLAQIASEAGAEREAKRERERLKKRRQRAGSAAVPGDAIGDEDIGGGDVSGTQEAEAANVPPGLGDKGHKTTGEKNEGSNEPSPPAPKRKSTSRGTRIPWDWVATAADRIYATTHGFTPEETRAMEEAFFDFWKAKAGAKSPPAKKR